MGAMNGKDWGGRGCVLFEGVKNGRAVVAFYSEVRYSVPASFHV
jgi:hypothetical protein